MTSFPFFLLPLTHSLTRFLAHTTQGYLTVAEFRGVLTELGGLGSGEDQAEVEQLVLLADPRGEGCVYYEKLADLVSRSLAALPLFESK